jgi:hypothetical protein
MKFIKDYRLYENNSNLEELCKKYIGDEKYYSITKDGFVDLLVDSYTLEVDDEIPIKFGEARSFFIKGGITSLHNSPRIINYSFNIDSCPNIKSFLGAPDYINKFFHVGSLSINNLEGLPRPLIDSYQLTLSLGFNNLQNILLLFLNPLQEYTRVRKDIVIIDKEAVNLVDLFNDYDPLRENGIVLDRLNSFLDHIGKNPVKEVRGYKSI